MWLYKIHDGEEEEVSQRYATPCWNKCTVFAAISSISPLVPSRAFALFVPRATEATVILGNTRKQLA